MNITTEVAEKRIKELQHQRSTHIITIQAIDGALQEWTRLLEAAKASNEAQLELLDA